MLTFPEHSPVFHISNVELFKVLIWELDAKQKLLEAFMTAGS